MNAPNPARQVTLVSESCPGCNFSEAGLPFPYKLDHVLQSQMHNITVRRHADGSGGHACKVERAAPCDFASAATSISSSRWTTTYRKKINISTVMAGQGWALKRSTTEFGSSLLCTMIWDISIWSKKPCKPSTIRSARDCHLCLRYETLPMSPGWTTIYMVGAQGFEPWTR